MGLLQVATSTVTGTPTTVSLTGINDDSVYLVAYNNVTVSSSGVEMMARVTVGGTADSSSEYDNAFKFLRADASFSNASTQMAQFLISSLNKFQLEEVQMDYYIYITSITAQNFHISQWNILFFGVAQMVFLDTWAELDKLRPKLVMVFNLSVLVGVLM